MTTIGSSEILAETRRIESVRSTHVRRSNGATVDEAVRESCEVTRVRSRSARLDADVRSDDDPEEDDGPSGMGSRLSLSHPRAMIGQAVLAIGQGSDE